MNFNGILSINDVTDDSEVALEPVTVQEMKDYMRLEGFVDVDESTTDALSDFDLDDTLIGESISAARELIEMKTGLVLIPKTIEVVFTNLCGGQELPGPVGTLTILLDSSGDSMDVADVELVGNKFKSMRSPLGADMIATYEAGYGRTGLPLPKLIKADIMRVCFYLYQNRGDQKSIDEYTSFLSFSYSRVLM